MKKIILFFLILFLSQCQIGFKEAMAQKSIGNVSGLNDAKSWTYQADNMTYRIFAFGDGAHSASLVVINVTKENLEIEKLKLEIKKLQEK